MRLETVDPMRDAEKIEKIILNLIRHCDALAVDEAERKELEAKASATGGTDEADVEETSQDAQKDVQDDKAQDGDKAKDQEDG